MLTPKASCRFARLVLVASLAIVAGCSSKPGRVAPPKIDAASAAALAMQEFDRDGDESLNAAELAKCPALAYALPRYDSNKDGALTQSEIETGINRWTEAMVGLRSLPFRVMFNGRALEGAQVRLVPVSFLDGAIKPATGEAGRGGNGFLGLAPEDCPRNAPNLPLVQPGLYRVEITHPTQSIPAKYNSGTILGLEVASDSIGPEGIVWTLTKDS